MIRFLTICATAAALVLSVAGAAAAAPLFTFYPPVVQPPVITGPALPYPGAYPASAATANAYPYNRYNRYSDANLWRVRRNLERIIDNLQRDQHDYNGHRIQAITELQAARADIITALGFDRGHEYVPTPSPAYVQNGAVSPGVRWANGSDANLQRMAGVLGNDIGMLEQDRHDYGGYRVKAIGEMQQGENQINLAIESDRGH